MTVRKTSNGDIEIAYETFGLPTGRPLLLVMGIGGQMLNWPERFCRLLADRGFRVARFDNRDSGLSTRLSAAGKPNQLTMLLRPASAAVYRLDDMADDAIAVLDALSWPAANVVGISQGGMIAQAMALGHPDRVYTLTSISSSPAPRIGHIRPTTLLKLLRVTNPQRIKTADDLAEHMIRLRQITGSPGDPSDEASLRELAHACYERGGYDLAAMQRQTAAIAASGDRRAALAQLRTPTLVIHGENDRIIRLPAGKATANAIPGARLVVYPGMGHNLPEELWPAIIDEITTLAEQRTTGPDTTEGFARPGRANPGKPTLTSG